MRAWNGWLLFLAIGVVTACSDTPETNGGRDASTADVSDPSDVGPPEADADASRSPDTARDAVAADTTRSDAGAPLVLGGDRPATVFLPADYDPEAAYPVVLALHDYASDADAFVEYLRLTELIDSREFILLMPQGRQDSNDSRFWNANERCCDFDDAGGSDVDYLHRLMNEATLRLALDVSRIYVIGHGNGADMAYRLACERADRFAAIATLSGSSFVDADQCEPVAPVAVAHVHGTENGRVSYDGIDGLQPGAEEMARRWVDRNLCAPEASARTPVDIDASVNGDETERVRWTECTGRADVELWTIEGGQHRPTLSKSAPGELMDFLLDHRIPSP